MHVTCYCGSVLLWRRRDTLCTSGFVDDVVFFLSVCLQGNVALEKSKHKKPFAWIPELGWEDAVRLVEISPDAFGNLLDDIEQNEAEWKKVRSVYYRLLPAVRLYRLPLVVSVGSCLISSLAT